MKTEPNDLEITNVKTFFIVWFNALRCKDSLIINLNAWLILIHIICFSTVLYIYAK